MSKLEPVSILNSSGVKETKVLGKIPPLRSAYYHVLPDPIGGDAPKDFIQAYQYGTGKRTHPKTWPKYIAKVGHKWYPMESITEHMLNEIGRVLGLRMAVSELRVAHGQLRFLSQFFLEKGQSLTHGAEIYSAYLGETTSSFVDEVESQNLTREWFTFQFTKDALQSIYQTKAAPIIADFVRMQVFDAFVGNNDRHFYNWGVIEDVTHKADPYFSPIFDSARGLFWNKSETALARIINRHGVVDLNWMETYIRKSMPKIGWEGEKKVTHFEQMTYLQNAYPEYRPICQEIINPTQFERVKRLLKDRFKLLMSEQRFMLVNMCLLLRYQKLRNIFQA